MKKSAFLLITILCACGVYLALKMFDSRIDIVSDFNAVEQEVHNEEVNLLEPTGSSLTKQNIDDAKPELEITDQYLDLGSNSPIQIKVSDLTLTQILDDGTTQYIHKDGTIVTILADGKVLLLPQEI